MNLGGARAAMVAPQVTREMHGRQLKLEDAAARAQSFRPLQLQRIDLDMLLIWPQNWGHTGIIPHHVHEVAGDVLVNRTSAARCGHVCVVEDGQTYPMARR